MKSGSERVRRLQDSSSATISVLRTAFNQREDELKAERDEARSEITKLQSELNTMRGQAEDGRNDVVG